MIGCDVTESGGDATAPPTEDTFPGFPAVEQTRTEPSASDVPVFMPPVDNAHVPHTAGDASHVLTPGDAAIAAPPRPWKEVCYYAPGKICRSHRFFFSSWVFIWSSISACRMR